MTAPPQYDLFISYAREDNRNGHISQLKESLEARYRNFFGDRELNIFLDSHAIVTGDIWREKIHTGLTESKVMLVMLSENYLASKWCRKEWEAWCRLERDRGAFRGLLLPAYYIKMENAAERVNSWLAQAEDVLKHLEYDDDDGPEYEDTADNRHRAYECLAALRDNQYIELYEWYEKGKEALKRDDVKKRLDHLNLLIDSRLRIAERASMSPSNIRCHSARFVGRLHELKSIRESFKERSLGKLPVLYGPGGEGKTTLALEYAHAFAHEYPGGRWLVDCSVTDDLRGAIISLGEDRKPAFMFAEGSNEESRFQQILGWLKNRPEGASLVILDNIDAPEMVSEASLTQLGEPCDALHILATTRCDGRQFQDSTLALEVKGLPLRDSLRLLDSLRKIGSEDREAVRRIVEIMGGNALCLELSGAFLRDKDSISYAKFSKHLESNFLPTLEKAREKIGSRLSYGRNRLPHVEFLVAPTLEACSPFENRALLLASLLDPNGVIEPWVKAALAIDFPECNSDDDLVNPWDEVKEKFTGLGLWRREASGDPQIYTMHRLVREVVRARATGEAGGGELLTELVKRLNGVDKKAIINFAHANGQWKTKYIKAMLPTVMAWLENDLWAPHTRYLAGRLGDALIGAGEAEKSKKLIEKVLSLLPQNVADNNMSHAKALYLRIYGYILRTQYDLSGALKCLEESRAICTELLGKEPQNTKWQHGLCATLHSIAHIHLSRGDIQGALNLYEEAEILNTTILEGDQQNTYWQNEQAIILQTKGQNLQMQGNFPEALKCHEEAHTIWTNLLKNDPRNGKWKNSLADSLGYISGIIADQGNLPEAVKYCMESRDIRAELVEIDSQNAEWRNDFANSLDSIAYVLYIQGDLSGALQHVEQSHDIRAKLLEVDPQNAKWQNVLARSLTYVGTLLQLQGDLAGALKSCKKALTMWTELAESDQHNTDLQCALASSLTRVGYILHAQRDLPGAMKHHEESRAVMDKLVTSNSNNPIFLSGLAVRLDDIAYILHEQGDLSGALKRYEESLAIQNMLQEINPQNTDWQHSLAVTLRDMDSIIKAQGDLPNALKYRERSRAIKARLVENNPQNSDWQEDLAESSRHVDAILRAQYVSPENLRHHEELRAHWAELLESDPHNADLRYNFAISLANIAFIHNARENFSVAAEHYKQARPVLRGLVESPVEHADLRYKFAAALADFAYILKLQNRFPPALHYYKESCAILAKLVSGSPNNTLWLSKLAVGLNNIGDFFKFNVGLASALKHCEKACAIWKKLLEIDSLNSDWQGRLSTSLRTVDAIIQLQSSLPKDEWQFSPHPENFLQRIFISMHNKTKRRNEDKYLDTIS